MLIPFGLFGYVGMFFTQISSYVLQAHLNDEKLTILFVLKYRKTEKPQSQS